MKFKYFIILFFLLIVLAAHWAAYQMAVLIIPAAEIQNPNTLWALLFLLSFMFVPAAYLAYKHYGIVTRYFYTAAAHWLGLVFYLVFASAIWATLTVLFPNQSTFFALILWATVLIVCIYGLFNARNIKRTHYTVALPNLPTHWKNKRAVLVTDIHLGPVNHKKFAEKVVREINDINPDLIFLSGDFFDGLACDEKTLAKVFSNLKALSRTYFVTGNHDGFKDSAKEVTAIKEAGITVLEDEIIEIDGLQLAGVGYRETSAEEKFVHVLSEIKLDPTRPSILLKHIPIFLKEAEQKGFALTLSGHTHNGQLFPANFVASSIHEGYGYGFKKYGQMQVIVSSGVGSWGPPMRVGTKSEIVILSFE